MEPVKSVLRWHILLSLQEWLRISRIELDRNPPLCRELRDFLVKVSSCGAPYQQWCTELRQEFPALVSCSAVCVMFLSADDVTMSWGLAVSFVIFVCPSFRKEQLGLQCKIKKVKVILVEALRLCTGCTAQRGSRGIALPFHDQRH